MRWSEKSAAIPPHAAMESVTILRLRESSSFVLILVMKASDDACNEESVVTAGRVAPAKTYCLASIGESTMEIKFTTGVSPLGSVLVAATDKGVCAVSLRESEAGAEEHLRARFPKAELKRDDTTLRPALDTVCERIAGRKLDSALPLDLQGTDFQQEVWSQLLSIPPGKNAIVSRRSTGNQSSEGDARGCAGLRSESSRGRRAVSPSGDERRLDRRLQRATGSEESAACGGRRGAG